MPVLPALPLGVILQMLLVACLCNISARHAQPVAAVKAPTKVFPCLARFEPWHDRSAMARFKTRSSGDGKPNTAQGVMDDARLMRNTSPLPASRSKHGSPTA
jgi:hypothetical protein